jgi:hypothetical protein
MRVSDDERLVSHDADDGHQHHAQDSSDRSGRSARRVEVIIGGNQRRRWSGEDKARITAASFVPGANIAAVAREHGVSQGLLHYWRRCARWVTERTFAWLGGCRRLEGCRTLHRISRGVDHDPPHSPDNQTARKVLISLIYFLFLLLNLHSCPRVSSGDNVNKAWSWAARYGYHCSLSTKAASSATSPAMPRVAV